MAEILKKCETCHKTFEYMSYPSVPLRKFCSKNCSNQVPHRYWLGRKRDAKTLKKMSNNRKGVEAWNKGMKGWNKNPAKPWLGMTNDKNPAWAGDEVGYRGLHLWVYKQLGKPERCSQCSKVGYGRGMHWANLSHEYKRDIKDWIRLCPKCHKQYDKGILVITTLT